jgi:hypothetical protein
MGYKKHAETCARKECRIRAPNTYPKTGVAFLTSNGTSVYHVESTMIPDSVTSRGGIAAMQGTALLHFQGQV